jgi:hypothetical protein
MGMFNMNKCECGCGELVNKRYVKGHQFRGKKQSEEHIRHNVASHKRYYLRGISIYKEKKRIKKFIKRFVKKFIKMFGKLIWRSHKFFMNSVVKSEYVSDAKCCDCDKPISGYGSERCVSCSVKHRLKENPLINHFYKDGRTLKRNLCADCGKTLGDYRAKVCKQCSAIRQKKGQMGGWGGRSKKKRNTIEHFSDGSKGDMANALSIVEK